jgi:endonuclease/exonuclease/phosphatase family metal-dependent hydrolase
VFLVLLLIISLLATALVTAQQEPEEENLEDLKLESANILPPVEAAPETVRVVSFNVKLGLDVGKLARFIQENATLARADIFLIQEIESFPDEGASRTRKLAERLRLNYVYAPARHQLREEKNGTHGLAILSRYPLQDLEILPLPFFKLRVRSRRRIALAATVVVPGGSLRLYNLHLDTRLNVQQRLVQLQPVVDAAQANASAPVIIGGDFNTNPFRWAWSSLPWFRSGQAVAVDKYLAEAGFTTPLTEAGSTARRGWMRFRLDSLYSRGVTVGEHGIVREGDVSDHYPLWMDLEWPPENSRPAPEPVSEPPE